MARLPSDSILSVKPIKRTFLTPLAFSAVATSRQTPSPSGPLLVVPWAKLISFTRYLGWTDGAGLGMADRSQLVGCGSMIWEPVGAGVCVVVSAIGPSSFLLEQ